MHIVSVQIGSAAPLQVGASEVTTGFFKLPVDFIEVLRDGVSGDFIGNLNYHGGPDQAVYIYSLEDYRYWEEQVGRPLPLGTFGDNLTVSHFPTPPQIGDRWRIGEVEMEVTAPRVPCAKLAVRLQDPTFVKRFIESERPGVYMRVLREGRVQPQEQVEVQSIEQPRVSATDVFRAWHQSPRDSQLLRHCLQAPLAERFRTRLNEYLQRTAP